MPCTVYPPPDEGAHFENLLCQACKYLTKKQIDSLRNPGSGIIDGLTWYSQHLMNDYTTSDKNGLSDKVSVILHELNRIGYDIKKLEYGWQLVRVEE